jgi:hypothetical protein
MNFAPNYLASKIWEEVGRQELRSTLNKREIGPCLKQLSRTVGPKIFKL